MADDDDLIDPESDPDFRGGEGSSGPMTTGPEYFATGAVGGGIPLSQPLKSIPLEEDDPESRVPPALLWAMKYRRHVHLLGRADEQIRACLGSGDGAIGVIDDGRKHCTISRVVGSSPDGCLYCLVGQITVETYDRLAAGETPLDRAFSEARDIALCAVFEAEQAVSNVSLVERYADVEDVPPDYLPPSPSIAFTEDLEPED